jgi:DNA polymerase I-like protein with 3'-5' exonuclease and polymerase domains
MELSFAMINFYLVDSRTPRSVIDKIKAELSTAKLYGLDCETQDEGRHPGLEAYNNGTRHVFDHRRTVMTGFSTYVEGSDTAYYFNLAHKDVDNRLDVAIAHEVLDAASDDAICVAHNAPFEIVMFRQCLGRAIKNLVCTLQMAVSHHAPDEYDLNTFYGTPLPAQFRKLVPEILIEYSTYEGGSTSSGQQELLGKFIAKESKAEHSYNGFVKSIAKGYALKQLTKNRFGYEQATFKDTLDAHGATHMGELTGEQVCTYGADDAYWAVQHYRWMFNEMLSFNPHALRAFFETENPMVEVYADSWQEGIRLDLEAVFERQRTERIAMAQLLRDFKGRLRRMLPFPEDQHARLAEKEDWYAKNWLTKRKQIEKWAASPDSDDDFTMAFQVSNPIGNAWAIEQGVAVPKAGKLNLVYYHGMRTIMYDLLRVKMQYDQGKVASDSDARGRVREWIEKQLPVTATPMDMDDPATARWKLALEIMVDLQEMSDIEQRMKLYLTPYTQLMDPETSRVYPSLSSRLATRRLATSFPNPMQLAKSGNSAYIRGFYLPDDPTDSVVVSADWSAIELVLIGDLSGDPGFAEVYGQIPYGDMHSGAAVDALSVKTLPGLTEEEFREFKFGRNPNNRILRDFSGRDLSPSDYHKFTRGTPVGKGVNFSYWYSGALSTVATNLGWSDDEHWEAVDKYRARFPVAEGYRVGLQDIAVQQGYVELPDGHWRTRFECTWDWQRAMKQKFIDIAASPSMERYADLAIRRIQSRSKNQVVNAVIQGTCATLAKRSVLTLQKLCAVAGLEWRKDYRLMMPIHDELVFSVRRECVMQFIPLLRQAMTNHKDIVKTLPLNCTVAIGRTFRPFNKADPRLSQIELDEAQMIEGVIPKELEGTVLGEDKIAELLDYMFAEGITA